MSNHTFVPLRVAQSISDSLPEGVTLGEELVLETEDGFFVEGYTLGGEAETISAACPEHNLVLVGAARSGETLYSVLSRRAANSTVTHESSEDGEAPPSKRNVTIEESAVAALQKLESYTGLKFSLHFHHERVANLYPADANTYHIVVGASPPGAVRTIDRQRLCGLRLDSKYYWVKCNGPTAGRGGVFKDADDVTLGQIVDRTIYLFTPRLNQETSSLFSSEGGNLLLKMLQRISFTLAHGFPSAVVETIDSAEAFVTYVQMKRKDASAELHNELKRAHERSDQARAEYREATHDIRNWTSAIEFFDTRVESVSASDLGGSWERIHAHPLVAKVEIIEGALHVHTRRVIALEKGVRYDFGHYVIRMRVGGQVSVWSVNPTHPGGLAHPHISTGSTLCFGNAGLEIERAAEELRLADALELVLEWLEQGYDATLATHKIEEWPLYKEET